MRNVDLTLPSGKLVIITGVSGSGKSSLAFDTIYAEGQRRYVESLSAYARQFLERMEKPDVDSIEGVSPSIAIRQKNSVRNPRSTVSTTTEIHDYLRLLYARRPDVLPPMRSGSDARRTAEVVARRLTLLRRARGCCSALTCRCCRSRRRLVAVNNGSGDTVDRNRRARRRRRPAVAATGRFAVGARGRRGNRRRIGDTVRSMSKPQLDGSQAITATFRPCAGRLRPAARRQPRGERSRMSIRRRWPARRL